MRKMRQPSDSAAMNLFLVAEKAMPRTTASFVLCMA
jgi:hypothetical protein